MPTLTLLRHGESEWNKQNRFTGWVDVDLSEEGVAQARRSGEQLMSHSIKFDALFTSYLRRAVNTLREIQLVTDTLWMPVATDWRLNERHYGGLQGLNKDETREKHGAEQVKVWRRSYATPPPESTEIDKQVDDRYAKVTIPRGESLKDCLERVMPCWQERLKPKLDAGHNLLIAAHGNSLRALAKHLNKMDDDEIMLFEIPTGVPLVYELADNLGVKSRRFLEG